VLDTEAVNLSQ